MSEDWDEDTFETLSGITSEEVIDPIVEMRRKKAAQENTFTITRENYEKSTDMQVEAWFTKFDDVIIDDSANPYKEPLTKKEILFKVIGKINLQNLDTGITKFNKGVDLFVKMTASSQKKTQKKKRKTKSKGFGITQKEYDEIFPKRRVKFF